MSVGVKRFACTVATAYGRTSECSLHPMHVLLQLFTWPDSFQLNTIPSVCQFEYSVQSVRKTVCTSELLTWEESCAAASQIERHSVNKIFEAAQAAMVHSTHARNSTKHVLVR